jgi:hypothetical protein
MCRPSASPVNEIDRTGVLLPAQFAVAPDR